MMRLGALVFAALLASSCGIERPPYGGDQERALATATVAVDVGAVTRLLDAHADPNGMVDVSGSKQSPWFLALSQLRPDRPGTLDIIRVMLKAGANPNAAWGTGGGDPRRPQASMWRKFISGSRVASTSDRNPLRVVMMHPVPDAARALVAAGLDPRLGQEALVSAIETGEVEIVHILVDAGVDVNCHPGASTPLLAAIETRNVALMTYLEEHGARERP